MADILTINRSELVGFTRKSAVVESLIQNNALNCTGSLNYNAGGIKDGVGFEKVTETFVDNFLLRVLVPDYNIQKGKNIFIASQNKCIRELLDANRLEKCIVKAVRLIKLKEEPTKDMIDRMPCRDVDKFANTYYYQEFKIACPNLNYTLVMDFIRNGRYNGRGFLLKDFDITTDYAGSFDKYEVIDHFTINEGFREQGECEDASRTIVNNDNTVGKNCLTYMETINGFTTRQKVYNKMVQMLECKSVRGNLGCHWKDWVCQTGTRLADARDKATNRGLTRAEVTFYVNTVDIPDDIVIANILQGIVKYIPKSLVYSTPYSATWKAYCDTFLHSLVCIDRREDVGVIVYSYNEVTRNISGQYYEKWSEREKWCIDKLTLNGTLPLDIIEANTIRKTVTENGKKKDVSLEFSGARYLKINKDSSTTFTTRLVSKGGAYSYNNGSVELNASLLEKAGFLEHENCVPYLATSQGSKTHKADAELRKIDSLNINILTRKAKKDQRHLEVDVKEKLCTEAKQIEEIRKPLLLELQSKEREIKSIQDYKKLFAKYGTVPLRNLKQGLYTVKVAKKQLTRFGSSYKLLLEDENDKYIVWSNKQIVGTLEKILQDQLIKIDGNFLSLDEKPLGMLTITGQDTNRYGNITVYCKFVLNNINKEIIKNEGNDKISGPVRESCAIPLVPREELLPYREYKNLNVYPIGSIQEVEAMSYIIHYGTPRLVLKIEGTFYQAGQDIEEKVEQLRKNCSVKIEKYRVNATKQKYAICSIYEQGDWTAMVDYTKAPMLSKQDGSTCIVDVRSVNIKGLKRKLLLTDKGDVYKLKRSKLEETIKPGFI